jgi:hypothetical protein
MGSFSLPQIHPASPPKEPPRWTKFEGTVAICFGALVLFHCVAVLSFSARHGRLAMVPFFDDVVYLNDGIKRLDAFDRRGVAGLALSFLRDAPHAPYSSLLATVGFVITPKNMLGPYALNAIWVVIFLALIRYLVRGLPKLTQIGLMIASLAVPMLANVMGSFRPDTYWGLITGAVAIILATTDLGRTTRAGMIRIGLLVGGAALSKPTGMPPGLVVMGIGYCGATAAALLGDTVTPRQMLGKSLLALFGFLILVVPFLVVGGSELLDYIRAVAGSDSVWKTEGSLRFQLAYYLAPNLFYGVVGWLVFAGPVVLLAGIVSAGLSRNRTSFVWTIGVCASILMAYAIPAISPVKSALIGSLSYGTFIAGAVWSLGRLLRAKRVPGIAVLLVGSAVFVGFWRPDALFVAAEGQGAATIDKANRFVTPPILELLAAGAAEGQRLSVYVSSPGPVLDATIEYEALLRAIPARFVGDYADRDWSSILARAKSADIAIASEAGALGQGNGFARPAIQYQDRLIETLAAEAAWRELTTFVDEAGFKTIVFTRFTPAPVSAVKLSFGTGFQSEEGPYLDLRLPRFHWMVAQAASLTARDTATSENFGLRCQGIADVKLSVLDMSERTLVTQEIHARIGSGHFDTIHVPLDKGIKSPIDLSLRVSAPSVAIGNWPGLVLCATSALGGASYAPAR